MSKIVSLTERSRELGEEKVECQNTKTGEMVFKTIEEVSHGYIFPLKIIKSEDIIKYGRYLQLHDVINDLEALKSEYESRGRCYRAEVEALNTVIGKEDE